MSAVIPDWERERLKAGEWNPGKALLSSIRDFQRASSVGWGMAGIVRRWAIIRHRVWTCVSGADIPLNCTLGGGLMLPHPNGVVIHPHAVIGPNCLIFQQVTIGVLEGSSAPQIGGHVDIGAGARLLGDVRIGDHAKIGANAVVLKHVPEGHIAVGVPAVIASR